MSECSHNCGTCGENCSSRTQDKKSFLEALAPAAHRERIPEPSRALRIPADRSPQKA